VPLLEDTVRPHVEAWAAAAPIFTPAETDAIVQRIVRISEQVTPLVVADVALLGDRLQRYLLSRAMGRIEDWLVGAAARLRNAYGIENERLMADGAAPAVGLRAATDAELLALPGSNRGLAAAIGSFVAQQPDLTNEEQLIDVDGIGPGRLALLRSASYLDQPRIALLSPTLLTFILAPGVPTFLEVLERTELTIVFGDGSTLLRRAPAVAQTPAERFIQLLDLIREHATRERSVAQGKLASNAERWLNRHDTRERVRAQLAPVSGGVLVNDAYIPAAQALIDNATTTAKLMVFLGTAAAGTAAAPGPLTLVQAMEAAAARGVTVRVILDQDDGGEPYGSLFINRPLVQRFRSAGVAVKLDDPRTLLHSKVLVVDRQAAIVGSHNWTNNSFHETHEVSILLRSPAIAGEFDDRFQALWDQLPAL
jgi:hypothetical protein